MPSDTIKLNLVNNSADCNNSQILIFQKNVATTFAEIAVAWRVIENLGNGWNHPFTYTYGLEVGASDSYGNQVPPQSTDNGQLWTVVKACSGDQISRRDRPRAPARCRFSTAWPWGAISANIYRDGNLLATKTGVAPGQKAVFAFKPVIFLAVVSQIEEGDILDSAIISSANAQLSLFGIASADIVLTGGGPGKSSTPFTFTLANVVYA